jgi:hypothetical protein
MNTPTGYSALDLVGFTDRGDYSSSETYVKNDLVHYLGDIWRVKLDDITGQTPSEGTYYTIFIEGIPDKAYKTDDTTENTLASDDVLPFYDTSASAKRKMPVQKFAEQLISNPNLLDNPWFTVNQREKTTYSGAGYTVDRWKSYINDATISISNNGITITRGNSSTRFGLLQHFENLDYLRNKVVTASIMLSDGTIKKATFTIPDTADSTVDFIELDGFGTVGGNFRPSNPFIGIISNVANASITIRAVKLELGSVSTLAMDTAPNYATELLKCQRYCIALNPFKVSYMWFGSGLAYSATEVDVLVPVPVAMRANPVLVDGTHLKLNDGTGFITPSFASIYRGAGVLKFVLTTAGMTIAHPYLLGVDNNDLMLLSADL